MIDITFKNTTLRKAIAQAIVRVGHKATMQAILDKKVPKGDVFEMAKVAGLFAAKKTSEMIPDCHPLPGEQLECPNRRRSVRSSKIGLTRLG